MAESNRLGKGIIGREGVPRDEISLEENGHGQVAPSGAMGGTSSQDSVLNVAHVFEAQLEQMTAWKHQLAQQMELLRRDGVKLLEKQKNLSLEKKRLAEERESILADRAYVQKLHQEVETENKRLEGKGVEISRGLAELQKLAGDKEKWEEELKTAQAGAAAAREAHEKMAGETQAAEARLAELQGLAQRRTQIEQETAAAEQALAALREQVEGLEKSRQELESRAAQMAAREQELANREAKLAAEDAQVKAGLADLATQREELTQAQRETTREREELAERRREVEEAAAAAAEGIDRDRAQAQEQVAEAKAAMEGLNEARARQEQRWTSMEARAAELAASEEVLEKRAREIERQEKDLITGRRDADEAQGRLVTQQSALIAAEKQVAEKLQAAETLRADLESQRTAVIKQREELEKKLDLMEGELAEQFELVAKQTRRLTERRAELDARSMGVEKDAQSRIAGATAELQEQLRQAQGAYESRVRALEEQIRQTEAAAAGWKAREAELQKNLGVAGEETAALKKELERVGEEWNTESRERIKHAAMLAEQVMRFEKEAAAWQKKVEEATTEGASLPSSEQFKAAVAAAEGARAQVEALQGQLEELTAARGDLERRLEAEAGRTAELQKNAEALAQRLGAAELEVTAWREKLEAANSQSEKTATEASTAQVAGLTYQLKMLEQLRDDLAGQLSAVKDEMRRAGEEALLAKNVMEGEILTLRSANQVLELKAQENAASVRAGLAPATDEAVRHLQETTNWHRVRLLRQARNLRAYRKQMRESQSTMAAGSEDLARQREQLRSRKENLEQVKRLLEKQEMVMARKLADHNALKTVAAVGIFVIMILGSVFFGVYKFVNPIYRSEALVQLNPPANLKPVETEAWLAKQMDVVKSNDVTFAAWKILRAPDQSDQHYAMHDVREAWLASLGKNLSLRVDSPSKTLYVVYNGDNAEGVAQVCNALATAYSTPGVVAGTDATTVGGHVSAKAAAPSTPSEDNRVMVSLSVVAIVLFISLLLVILFRHYVTRQLKEIDQMADEADLADIKGEMA